MDISYTVVIVIVILANGFSGAASMARPIAVIERRSTPGPSARSRARSSLSLRSASP
ncbi:hypothetical protein HLB23_15390 [Nocardia uniformis]|uniref:Uncharacterized protein n=1 Tax=Nocardia uniformis TaxID=53432 RepID=A0A849BXC4_9NOCA|nr:hypothetical protein [Nocardia uniformis]NNH71233.1 hypothetical protein [Nocardia uniformis]